MTISKKLQAPGLWQTHPYKCGRVLKKAMGLPEGRDSEDVGDMRRDDEKPDEDLEGKSGGENRADEVRRGLQSNI